LLPAWRKSCICPSFCVPPPDGVEAVDTTSSADRAGRPLRLGIVGSYGGCNLGDEAILDVIVTQLRGSLPVELTVFSHDPSHTLARHRVERAIALRGATRDEVRWHVERLDLLILGGGFLFDTNAAPYLNPVDVAQTLGIPTMAYAVGAGPLDSPIDRRRVRSSLNRAAVVTVRDRPSRQILEDVGVRRPVVVTADPAFLLTAEPLPPDALASEGLNHQRPLVAMSVRERGVAATEIHQVDYHTLLAHAADFVVDRYDADVVFVPMEPRGPDVAHAHAVMARMRWSERTCLLKGDYTPRQMLSWFDRFSLAVGLRLHFLIFAMVRQVPFVALPYAGKVAGFLDHLGLTTPSMQALNAGGLIAHIDRTWDCRDELRSRLAAAMPGLRDRAAQTHQLALDVLATPRTGASGRSQEPESTSC
jgi:polysaccharide pyruvyl transferase CsaB